MNLGRNATMVLSIVLLLAAGSWIYIEWPEHRNTVPMQPMDPQWREWFHTVAMGDTAGAAAMLKSDPSLLTANSPWRGTALHVAAMRDDADMIEFLLGKGADPMARGRWGGTPLHMAAFFGSAGAAAVLVRRTPVDTRCLDFKSTPLFWAAYGSGQGARDDGDYIGTCRLLLEAGAQVNTCNAEGMPAVNFASDPVAKFLIAHGATPPATQPSDAPPADPQGPGGPDEHHFHHGDRESASANP